jgi:STE24 endopeptidase
MSDATATRMPRVCSVRRSWRLPVALVAAVVVAEAAVLAMRPRDRGPEPVPVEPRAYFSEAQIEKAEAFRTGQLWIYAAQTAIGLGVLVLIVRRPPERLAAYKRPVLAGAAVAAAISVATGVAALPLAAVARQRAKDVGLVTQDWLGYAGDVAKGLGIEIVLTGAGGALLVFGMRRFGRRWWAPGAVLVVAFGVVMTYVSPVVLDPLFNRFEPLPRGPTRTAVLDYAERAGVKVGEVYEMDASRRTTAANAYVAGLGSTKRVVLYDTLLRDFSEDEVRLVVAHELGHVHYSDVPRGLLYLAIVAPLGMLAVARLSERMAPSGGPAAVPAVALSLALLVPAITTISNQLSRAVEARADRYSLELTDAPDALIGFQQRIVEKNVSDPEPPAWVHFLLGTHPTAMDRIGQALAIKARDSAAEPRGDP